jgi:4'-phosphopantetheinyl transferase
VKIPAPDGAAPDTTAIVHLGLVHRESPAAERALRSGRTSEDHVFDQRPNSALARALMRDMLARLTGSEPGRWKIAKAASGAPIALDLDGRKAPAISFSHSGLWIACAASLAGSVGIDVELSRESRNLRGIAERAFGIKEQAAAHRGTDRFYSIWTLREALAKATGDGLRLVTDAVDRVPDGPFEDSCWSKFDGADWWLMHCRPFVGLSLALALKAPPASVSVRWWATE